MRKGLMMVSMHPRRIRQGLLLIAVAAMGLATAGQAADLPTRLEPGTPPLAELMKKVPLLDTINTPEPPRPADDGKRTADPRDFTGVWKAQNHVLSPRVYAGGIDGVAPYNAKGDPIIRNRMHQSIVSEPYASAVLYCRPGGAIWDLGIGWLSQWAQDDDVVMMLIEQWQDYRTIYLNRSHPAKLVPSYMGHSVGHWEGDTLVVDTIGFKGSETTWIDAAGSPHGAQLHIVERIRKLDSDTLEDIATIEDPEFYTQPFQKRFVYKLRPGERLPERNCEETMRADIVNGKHVQ